MEKRLLIIEDNMVQCEMLRDHFTCMTALTIDVAHDIDSAMAKFEPGKYFAIILDLHLGASISQGIDLAIHFRGLDSCVYIAAVSGYGCQLDRDLVGVVDVKFSKPLDYGALHNSLVMWLIDSNRRERIMHYTDEKIDEYDKKMTAYTEAIARICAEHAEISEELERLGNFFRKEDGGG